MTTDLEQLLAETIRPSPSGLGGPSGLDGASDGWAEITQTVRGRHRRRTMVMRVSVVAFLGLCGLAALLSGSGVGVDSPAPRAPAAEGAAAAERLWPTNADRLAEWAPQPAWQWWLMFIVGWGVPLVFGWWRWFVAPSHLRLPVRSQRWARLGLAAHAAAFMSFVIGVGCGLGLLVVWDPLAVAMDNSLLASVFGKAVWMALIAASASIFALSRARRNPRLFDGAVTLVAVALAAQVIRFIAEGVIRNMIAWDQVLTATPDDPPRGLWRSLVGSSQLVGVEQAAPHRFAWLGVAILVVIGAGSVLMTRYLVRAAVGGTPRASTADRLRTVSLRSGIGAILILVGLGVPALLYLPFHQAIDSTIGEVPVLEGWEQEKSATVGLLPDPWQTWKTHKLGDWRSFEEAQVPVIVEALEQRGFVSAENLDGSSREDADRGEIRAGELRRATSGSSDGQSLILESRYYADAGPVLWVGAGVFDTDGVRSAQLAALPGFVAVLAGVGLLRRRGATPGAEV